MKKIILPVVIVLAAFLVAIIVIRAKPKATPRPEQVTARAVRVIQVAPQSVSMTVTSQGEVTARTATNLAAEVGGRVVSVSAKFVPGGFFEKGEILLSLDSQDYAYAIVQAELGVAEAELALQMEMEEGEIAVAEWQKIRGGAEPPPSLVSRKPHLARAQAFLAAAKASRQHAELNLERTSIRAPYKGRVRAKLVDVGQFLTPGAPVASVYAIDYAEIRVAIPDHELAFLEVPYESQGNAPRSSAPSARVRASFAGDVHQWDGWLSRLEGELDRTTRMAIGVVRVEKPYKRNSAIDRPPLTLGMFVEVEITGKVFDNIFVVPRAAIREDNRVALVDEGNRIRFRTVDILRRSIDVAYIRSGLSAEDRICVSSLEVASDGLLVTPFEGAPSQETSGNE